jgi:predicted nucleic acid-binding protein
LSHYQVLIYIDTSVLAAYYCPELLSTWAERALRLHSQPAISSLVEVELVSALARKVRAREMLPADAQRIHAVFQVHLAQGLYIRLTLDGPHFVKAAEWLATFTVPLHTLDALHVAVAALQGCPLLTVDVALAKACATVGVSARLIQ